jgi:hypothetical protein
VGAGRGVEVGEMGSGLELGTGEEMVLCKTGGISTGLLAVLQACPVKVALNRKAMSRMRFFFIDAPL